MSRFNKSGERYGLFSEVVKRPGADQISEIFLMIILLDFLLVPVYIDQCQVCPDQSYHTSKFLPFSVENRWFRTQRPLFLLFVDRSPAQRRRYLSPEALSRPGQRSGLKMRDCLS